VQEGVKKPATFDDMGGSLGNIHIQMNIRITALHNFALMGLAASLLAVPFDATAVALTFALVGILAVFFADYGRNVEPLRVPAKVVPISRSESLRSDLPVAA
jgi:sorbitol-specific phosphotransferase system component IIC